MIWMGLTSFFTAASGSACVDDSQNTTAVKARMTIHSDIEKGIYRGEVVR